VGEIVVTTLNRAYPLVRFGTGDLSAAIGGVSRCGRTNTRLRGWMGRADQRTKVKGMFVDPAQIAAIVKRHPGIGRARAIVTRQNDLDAIRLQVEDEKRMTDVARLAKDFQETTGLRVGEIEVLPSGALPNDGKVIDDQRRYD
jgi:phenylacetate-CoA ligase